MTSVEAERTLRDTARTAAMAPSEPQKAAPSDIQDDMVCMSPRMRTITTATASFAPLEMPKVYGPAMGLAKSVCSKRPARPSAPPKIAAAQSRGRRMFQITWYAVSPAPLPMRMGTICPTGTLTVPTQRLATSAMTSSAARLANTHATRAVRPAPYDSAFAMPLPLPVTTRLVMPAASKR